MSTTATPRSIVAPVARWRDERAVAVGPRDDRLRLGARARLARREVEQAGPRARLRGGQRVVVAARVVAQPAQPRRRQLALVEPRRERDADRARVTSGIVAAQRARDRERAPALPVAPRRPAIDLGVERGELRAIVGARAGLEVEAVPPAAEVPDALLGLAAAQRLVDDRRAVGGVRLRSRSSRRAARSAPSARAAARRCSARPTDTASPPTRRRARCHRRRRRARARGRRVMPRRRSSHAAARPATPPPTITTRCCAPLVDARHLCRRGSPRARAPCPVSIERARRQRAAARSRGMRIRERRAEQHRDEVAPRRLIPTSPLALVVANERLVIELVDLDAARACMSAGHLEHRSAARRR